MKDQHLNTLLLLISSLAMAFVTGCFPKCSDEDIEFMKAVENGEVSALKSYIEKGGDPKYYCRDWTDSDGGRFSFTKYRHVGHTVLKSGSINMISYYLNIGDEEDKEFILINGLWHMKNEETARIAIKSGAHIRGFADDCVCSSDDLIPAFRFAKNLGYDFNWQDPTKDGNTLLMKYCSCIPNTGCKTADSLLSFITFLVEDLGVCTDVVNWNGKTAEDLSIDPKVKAYLDGIGIPDTGEPTH